MRIFWRKPGDNSLLLWIFLGTLLRFGQLSAKPPWTDEFFTWIFSLGNKYEIIPLNQVITLDVLLQPLRVNPETNINDVISLLINYDNHPPTYFVLAHWWMKLWHNPGESVSLFTVRALPAFFGVLSIPAIYFVAKFTLNSRLVAQLAAAMMAVSPYGIYLAQEARHYSLAILFVIISLLFFLIAAQYIEKSERLPLWFVLLWILFNSLCLTVHYFLTLTLAAEAISLVILLCYLGKYNNWVRIGMVAVGTMTAGLAWILAFISRDFGYGMTEWVEKDGSSLMELISPIFQALAAWITMISLLPVESTILPLVVISGLIMLGFFIWALPLLFQGIKSQWHLISTKMLVIFWVSASGLFFILTYGFGIDITRGARFNFVYFPGVILLVAVSLASLWQLPQNSGKIAVGLIWIMGLFSAITVITDFGYQKYYHPNFLVPIIEANSTVPVLIASTHETSIHTGEMMGIGWQLQNHALADKTQFLLVHQEQRYSPSATVNLRETVNELPRPLDVWTVNFWANIELDNCVPNEQVTTHVDGYDYQLWHCL